MYSNSRERRVDEEASSKLFNWEPDKKSQLKTKIDGNRRFGPARCETNWEEPELKERRSRNP